MIFNLPKEELRKVQGISHYVDKNDFIGNCCILLCLQGKTTTEFPANCTPCLKVFTLVFLNRKYFECYLIMLLRYSLSHNNERQIKYKKVLLRERKRHTDRGVASTRYAAPVGGTPSPILGSDLEGGYPPAG